MKKNQSQQVIQQVHAADFLFQVRASVNIQRERDVFVSENFWKRLDVEVWNFDASYGECVPDFMELYLFKIIPL